MNLLDNLKSFFGLGAVCILIVITTGGGGIIKHYDPIEMRINNWNLLYEIQQRINNHKPKVAILKQFYKEFPITPKSVETNREVIEMAERFCSFKNKLTNETDKKKAAEVFLNFYDGGLTNVFKEEIKNETGANKLLKLYSISQIKSRIEAVVELSNTHLCP